MRKDAIKVIKQKKNEEVKETKIVQPKTENNIRRKLGNVVKDWISERQENSRKEKSFSENHILAWQLSNAKLNDRVG